MTTVILLGASGSGKTTIAEAFASRGDASVDVLHFDSIGVPPLQRMITEHGSVEAWQRAMTFEWMSRLARLGRPGSHILFEGQTRFSFVEEAAATAGLSKHVPILLDCDDEMRRRRLSIDRGQPELADQSMMKWARFLRDEALGGGYDIIDTSARTLAASVSAVSRFFD